MKRLLISISLFLGSINVYSQVLPDNPTLADITNLKEDISVRLTKIPNNEAEILNERNWITTTRASIQNLKNGLTRQGQNKTDMEKLKADLNGLVDMIININCSSSQDSRRTLEKVKRNYNLLKRDDNVFSPFEPRSEWNPIEERFDNIFQYFTSTFRPTSVPFTNGECLKLKATFSDPQLKKDINNFIEVINAETVKNAKDNNDKLNILNLTEQELSKYSEKLSESIQKISTKTSLQTNLYLMILVIGLLSIATIGVVRLFPDTVMREWVESGQVIQFVTVMILLSVIMALGLAGLLSENTLGTLLGGIGGYVLSQGVGRAAARAAIKEKQISEQPATTKQNENATTTGRDIALGGG